MTFDEWWDAHGTSLADYEGAKLGWDAAMEEAARLCDVNAKTYGEMGSTQRKQAARSCAIVIRGAA